MRHATRVLAIATLALGHTAAFAAVDCEKHALTMNDVRTCVLGQNDQAVENAYRPLERKLKQRNPDAASELAKSQASWTRFAGDTCNYVKAANPQQTIPEDAWMNCWVDFSQARVRILKKWDAQLDAPPPAQN
ncbi:lysozyme inhibitor LprI family protein [Burkholderia sp. Ac-20344]|uniref:lysozyme inhibitor LprI family protein n=1 Tax=Burkholderia sp. Ac-20344 TaxID=2703890 RepID=UPI00197B1CC4|nr:lysozyme inhibitor LprI family protein [Burkholderia sp. Ac-20344]MBN3833408.1 DUF1311 domain-containing protein [Burkholderia sp. Ac-20344]